MPASPRKPRPVPVRAYRYSKLRWRVLVRLLDAVGTLLMRAWRTFRPQRPFGPPRKILLVQLDHLGDAVLSSPLIARLRAAYPAARLDVLASASNRALFEADPCLNHVHVADRNWFERRPEGWGLWSVVWRLGFWLRPERYDLGIDVRGDVLSVLVLALAGIPRRVGWAMGGGGFLLTDLAEWVPGRHEVRSRLALLEPLELDDDEIPRVLVPISDRDRALVHLLMRRAWTAGRRAIAVREKVVVGARLWSNREDPIHDDPDGLHAGRFGDVAPLLAVHLGAGTAAKRWPVAHWTALLERFLDDGWRVVVVGGREDASAAEALPAHPNLRDWTGQLTVTETAAVLERAEMFLGADSGPAHLAASVGVTSVVLFSGTNQSGQWRPWSRRTLVLRQPVPCRPCHQKTCPLADHPCMTGLDPDRVYRAARRWWARVHHAESPHAPL